MLIFRAGAWRLCLHYHFQSFIGFFTVSKSGIFFHKTLPPSSFLILNYCMETIFLQYFCLSRFLSFTYETVTKRSNVLSNEFFLQKHISIFLYYALEVGCKLNVHKTVRRRSGRLLNVLCTFNLYPVSRGSLRNS